MKPTIGLRAENCQPPLGSSPEVIEYLRGLKEGERVVECGVSGLSGRCGTVYISERFGCSCSDTNYVGEVGICKKCGNVLTRQVGVCVTWDVVANEKGQMSSSVTGGTRRIKDAGTFSHLDDGHDGPFYSDGCDSDGCVRAGHTPENCPGFQIGDTVRFSERHLAAGDIGVIVAHEVWLNDNEAVPWDGVGDQPVFAGKLNFCANSPRYLVRLTEIGMPMIDSIEHVNGWREQCRQQPHNFPWVWDRDLVLVSRPQIKVLNDSGDLGSVVANEGALSCVSDSEAGARLAIAQMKAANGMALRAPKKGVTA